MSRADERENEFLLRLLEKHHARLKAQFDRYVVSILKVAPSRCVADGVFDDHHHNYRMSKSRPSKTRSSLAENGVELSTS